MTTLLITGANRGIGLELTTQALARGDRVIATCRRPGEAVALHALSEAHDDSLEVLPLDVTDEASVGRLAETVDDSTIDVLVNNAGIGGGESQGIGGMDYAAWAETLAVNTIAPFRVTAALLPALRRSTRPRVITLSSQMGSLHRKSGGSYAYRSSKAAVNKVMQVMAEDLRDDGVVIIPVHPGWVRTDMGGDQAPVSVEDSARGLLALIDRVTLAETGRFFTWTGDEHPW